MKYIIDKIKEPSTIRGLVMLLGLAGAKFSPEQSEAIIQTVVAVVGLIEIFRQETPKPPTP